MSKGQASLYHTSFANLGYHIKVHTMGEDYSYKYYLLQNVWVSQRHQQLLIFLSGHQNTQ